MICIFEALRLLIYWLCLEIRKCSAMCRGSDIGCETTWHISDERETRCYVCSVVISFFLDTVTEKPGSSAAKYCGLKTVGMASKKTHLVYLHQDLPFAICTMFTYGKAGSTMDCGYG